MKNRPINLEALDKIIRDSGQPFKENSVSYILTCPRCNKDKKLYIRKKDGVFICFRCANDGFKGWPEFALAEITSIPLEQLRSSLYGESKIDFSASKLLFNLTLPDEDFGQDDEEMTTVKFIPEIVNIEGPVAKSAEHYLCNKRGLKVERIKEYNLKFNTKWNTVVFPVEYKNNLYGWQERGIFNDFRYTLTGFKKTNMLMFQDRLLNSDHAILTEGPMDALKAHLCGGNVCSMGKLVSDKQLEILKNHVKKVYVALDPDAYKEINDICRKLNDDVEVYILLPPKGKKDLGECTEEEVFEQFKKAERYRGQIFLGI